ncbi:MAG: HD domain-containing phosphohydrolase [Gaiellaceae bacterium]
MRILMVDDDPNLRTLLRATFEAADVAVEEAENVTVAERKMRRALPDVILLDVRMPGESGIEFCRRLKNDSRTASVSVVLLTGSGAADANLNQVGADAVLQKPFSPLELLSVVERFAAGAYGVPFRPPGARQTNEDALLLYAHDLRHVLELERGQREALQAAYLETVVALASALETRDTGTRAHSQRVHRYAVALGESVDLTLIANPSTEYGFLLHDVGKIGIPDQILLKAGPLTVAERRRMQTHTILGEQMLGGVAFLQGEGLQIVRSHHERWDGAGYPDGLDAGEIPRGARIFAVADSLDAMTSHRPYRRALSWQRARDEILREAGRQFDPDVVAAFERHEGDLHEIRREFAAAA